MLLLRWLLDWKHVVLWWLLHGLRLMTKTAEHVIVVELRLVLRGTVPVRLHLVEAHLLMVLLLLLLLLLHHAKMMLLSLELLYGLDDRFGAISLKEYRNQSKPFEIEPKVKCSLPRVMSLAKLAIALLRNPCRPACWSISSTHSLFCTSSASRLADMRCIDCKGEYTSCTKN